MPFKYISRLPAQLAPLQFWTLLGFILTVPFSKALSNIFIVATAVLWLLQCFFERRVLFPKTRFNWIIGLFVLSLFISFLETNDLTQSIRGVSKVLQRLGLFFLTLQVFQSQGDLRKFFKVLSIGCAIILIGGFVQYFFGFDPIRFRAAGVVNNMPRITSSFEFPSQYAIYLIYVVFLYGMLAGDKVLSAARRVHYLLVSVLGFLSLALTFSRSGWIAALAALLLCVFFVRRTMVALLGLTTLVVFILLATPSHYLVHKDWGGKEQSVSERFTLWGRAAQMVQDHPLTGVGINTYLEEGKKYTGDKVIEYQKSQERKTIKVLPGYYAHNSFLQMAAESGLITITLYLIFLGSFLVLAITSIKGPGLEPDARLTLQGITAGTFGFLVFNCFESSLFSVQPAQLFYFFLAIGVHCIQLAGKSGPAVTKEQAIGK